ncbi:MAG: 30S ribosomal protein S2 [Acidimicrobiales bacterium]
MDTGSVLGTSGAAAAARRRIDGIYVDPAPLLRPARLRPRLVPSSAVPPCWSGPAGPAAAAILLRSPAAGDAAAVDGGPLELSGLSPPVVRHPRTKHPLSTAANFGRPSGVGSSFERNRRSHGRCHDGSSCSTPVSTSGTRPPLEPEDEAIHLGVKRNGIYLIDLRAQTLQRVDVAYNSVRDLVANGGTILFIGTKKQAQDAVRSYAEKCGMPYINERWLGGMLTNYQTMLKRVGKMKEYQRMRDSGEFAMMPKKEALLIGRELDKLERNLSGIRNMEKLPDMVFVIDTKKEAIGVTEANKLGIPVVAVVDTNCDPDVIQYVIPGNGLTPSGPGT